MLLTVFEWLLQLVGSIGLLFCLLVVYHVLRPQKSPAHPRNRFNKMRLLWMCLTQEHRFVDAFPWLRNSEQENLNPYSSDK